jgi:hypothetical protein
MIANKFQPGSKVLFLGNRTPEIVTFLYYVNKHGGWYWFQRESGSIGYTKKHYLKNI